MEAVLEDPVDLQEGKLTSGKKENAGIYRIYSFQKWLFRSKMRIFYSILFPN